DSERARLRTRVTILSFSIIFLLGTVMGLAMPPLTAMMEAIICRAMHPEVDAPPPPDYDPRTGPWAAWDPAVLHDEPICKSADVQGYLAMLRGWVGTLDSMASLLTIVPFGVLSDRWGRRPVIVIASTGLTINLAFVCVVLLAANSIPIWAILMSSACLLIGGGAPTVQAMLFTFLADVVPLAERSTVFFQMGAVFLCSQMTSGPLASVLMARNLWLSIGSGLALLTVANIAVLFYPETLQLRKQTGVDRPAKRSRADSSGSTGASGDLDDRPFSVLALWQRARDSVPEVRDFLVHNKGVVILLLPAIFDYMGGFVVQDLLLQYAAKRYDWSWSKATMLLSIRSASSLATLVVLLPAASWFCLHRLAMAGVAKDLWLARISVACQASGCLVIGLASSGHMLLPALVWVALGSGADSLVRSLLNALVEQHHVGILNTLIAFLEMVGMMVISPLMAKCLSVGVHLGGAWVGLPFFVAAAFYCITATVLYAFRLSRRSS
ncbi:major facilitator superfamily domain-containing protein, partial [Lasiosphaeria miniovina]